MAFIKCHPRISSLLCYVDTQWQCKYCIFSKTMEIKIQSSVSLFDSIRYTQQLFCVQFFFHSLLAHSYNSCLQNHAAVFSSYKLFQLVWIYSKRRALKRGISNTDLWRSMQGKLLLQYFQATQCFKNEFGMHIVSENTLNAHT